MLKYFIEFFGTFLLVAALGISGDPIAIGLILAAFIYIGADVTGGHFNPAVTLAAWAADEIPSSKISANIFSQLFGAFAAAAFVWWISGTTFVTQPDPSTTLSGFIAVEFIFSFFFILVFLYFIYPNRRRRNPIYGILAGGVLGACYYITEPYTGVGLNPALNLGYITADTINHGYSYYHLPVYLLTPLLGGLSAAYVHRKLST
jgi:aquaporin Z